MRFAKYHGLGNDYLVLQPADFPAGLTPALIRLICDRHYGVGSDGILFGPLSSRSADFGLRIFNPDGSETGKSGNGLRIFARWLVDDGRAGSAPFSVETRGGLVTCRVSPDRRQVTVAMGQVSFDSALIPVAGSRRDVLNETLVIDEEPLLFSAATIGNPHCVILRHAASAELARQIGPKIERHALFPQRTNVQFMEVLDRANIHIEIWERGAGYTLSSGSSSVAAAAVAHKLDLCDSAITVHMPGGSLEIELDERFHATLAGPVIQVCGGTIAPQLFASPEGRSDP